MWAAIYVSSFRCLFCSFLFERDFLNTIQVWIQMLIDDGIILWIFTSCERYLYPIRWWSDFVAFTCAWYDREPIGDAFEFYLCRMLVWNEFMEHNWIYVVAAPNSVYLIKTWLSSLISWHVDLNPFEWMVSVVLIIFQFEFERWNFGCNSDGVSVV